MGEEALCLAEVVEAMVLANVASSDAVRLLSLPTFRSCLFWPSSSLSRVGSGRLRRWDVHMRASSLEEKGPHCLETSLELVAEARRLMSSMMR